MGAFRYFALPSTKDAAAKKIRAVVTEARKSDKSNRTLAENVARVLRLSFVPREDRSFADIAADFGAEFIVTVKNGFLHIVEPQYGEELFFHPNMAHLRLKNLRLGMGDRMATAMKLAPGMSVLDCTLGLGSDAIVASRVVGCGGKVTGIEVNPLVAAMVARGLQNFSADSEQLKDAMRRVEVIAADHGEFLRGLPDDSFDVVYFDPMFRRPVKKSAAIGPLRPLSDSRPITAAVVAEALRVARCRVVMKERADSDEFLRLGFCLTDGGKYSKVGYGVIEKRTATEEIHKWKQK